MRVAVSTRFNTFVIVVVVCRIYGSRAMSTHSQHSTATRGYCQAMHVGYEWKYWLFPWNIFTVWQWVSLFQWISQRSVISLEYIVNAGIFLHSNPHIVAHSQWEQIFEWKWSNICLMTYWVSILLLPKHDEIITFRVNDLYHICFTFRVRVARLNETKKIASIEHMCEYSRKRPQINTRIKLIKQLAAEFQNRV